MIGFKLSGITPMILLTTLLFTILIPGTITILVPYFLLSSGSARFSFQVETIQYLGAIPILLGASMYFWCAWHFTFSGRGTPAPIDPPKELVVRGPYQYVRNPMYVGVLFLLLGEALLFESRALLEYTIVMCLAFHLIIVLYEEPALRRKFGEPYRRYCDSVSRWIPWRKRH